MENLLFPLKIGTVKPTNKALQNQLYQRIEEKVLKDRITREKELSNRENNVAVYLAQGYQLNEIADELTISPETVGAHRKNIYLKLNIHTHRELIAWFVLRVFNRTS